MLSAFFCACILLNMKILVLDNYDSFTFNLVHLVEKVSNISPVVKKNDEISIDEVAGFDLIILSPGPGLPAQAGMMPQLLRQYHKTKTILGVCLGLQAIGECFGAKLRNLPQVYHGLATAVQITDSEPLFKDCPPEILCGRYHSWVIDDKDLPEALLVTARDNSGNIMAVRHRYYDVQGVQFHPESILSEYGDTIIRNWLSLTNP